MDLLQTKLHPPPARENRVVRPRLLHKLDAAAAQKLTLVCAPAGYGKTTLLSEWASRRPAPFGWVSLDRSDNDLAQFIRYLLAAVQRIDPAVGSLILAMLQPPKPLPIAKVLITLLNDIAASKHEFVIVLDDYQEIDAGAVHEMLNQIIEHQPANLHLILAARADPPLNLPHLRGRGQLLELRAADLCFSPAEAGAFLKDIMGLLLPAEEIEGLTRKVEGWAAGLQIAAIFLQNQPDPAHAARAFTGSHRHILDYLAVEVVERLPQDIQDFLRQTAILDDLEASLCEAVTGRSDSAAVLERLDQENLFVIPLDEDHRWFRYHRLMAETLRRQTESLDRELLSRLHHRASSWYAERDMTSASIEHAFKAGDIERAAQLIEDSAEDVLKRSHIATLLEWFDRLPEELVRARPGLNLAYAWALLFKGGSIRAVQARLEESKAHTASEPASAEEAVMHALIATISGDPGKGVSNSRRALETLPAGRAFLRSIAADNLGIAYVIQGDINSAIQAFKESSALAQEAGNTMFAVAALCNLGGLYLVQGHLQLAAAVYRQALEQATTPTGQRLPVACRALMGLGEITREWNELEHARELLEEALRLSREYSEVGELVMRLNLSRVVQAQGDEKRALELIQRAQGIAVQSTASPIDDRLADASLARFWLKQGNIAGVSEWAARRGFEHAAPGAVLPGDNHLALPYDVREAEWMIFARLQLAREQVQAALLTLAAIQAEAQKQGRLRRLHEILVLMAIAHQQAGSTDLALVFLEQSLELAEPEGHVRAYIEEGLPMAKLLREAARRGISKLYCTRLLAAMHQDELIPVHAAGADESVLVEPLSERELEVLKLLADGCSNREISERLYISLSTVKGHVSNITTKLLAKNRTEAVARARQLGLLASN